MKIRCVVIGLSFLTTLSGIPEVCAQNTDAPSLVVMISIDQLRGDLVERFAPAFTGGFRRLLDDGFRYSSASHAHAVTHTAAGQATLSTGVFPSRSGIVANSWSQRIGSTWSSMYAVEDRDSPILGFETVEQLPGRSPKNLLREGLADWVRAQDPDARTVSVSSKDRSAITMGGQTDSNVYWLLPQLARFITSTYYANEYPRWLNRFNSEVMPGIVGEETWYSLVPDDLRSLARDDDAPYEGDGTNTTFPHTRSKETSSSSQQSANAWALSTPQVDVAVGALAMAAMDEFDLGQRGHVDYLAFSLSATDYVGHGYGPLSQEQFSNLINVDRVLGRLFDYFDEQVGEGRWVVGVSADHGVVTMPEAAQVMGDMSAERIDITDNTAAMGEVYQEAAQAGGTPDAVAERAARLLEERGVVAKAYTHRELTVGEPADSFAVMFRNSHYPGRAHNALSPYGIEVRFGPGDLVSSPRGTTHGSPYWYDRWVPLMLMGTGVRSGSSAESVYTVDMAPTLAALAGIRAPDDLDGKSIYPR